jgi:hypothetical protein
MIVARLTDIIISMANQQATYDDANLCIKLYELRREETMRKARQWFATFSASTPKDFPPMGTQENAYLRMVTSYWDMAASFVTSGVLNEELFMQTNGELLFVWEKVRDLVPQIRAANKNPNYMKNLETVGNAAIKRMPAEAYEAFSAMIKGAAASAGR